LLLIYRPGDGRLSWPRQLVKRLYVTLGDSQVILFTIVIAVMLEVYYVGAVQVRGGLQTNNLGT